MSPADLRELARAVVAPMVDPMRRRLQAMVTRAVVKLVDDSTTLQALQVGVRAGEVVDDVERFQVYGYTSVPVPGAEGIVLHLGGSADTPVVIAVDDRRYRLTGLAEGEVALYDDRGSVVHLKRDRIVIDHVADLPGTPARIDLGAGASKDVIRSGDSVASSAGAGAPTYAGSDDVVFWTWVEAVAAATSTTGIKPTSLTSAAVSGSGTVKAVD